MHEDGEVSGFGGCFAGGKGGGATKEHKGRTNSSISCW